MIASVQAPEAGLPYMKHETLPKKARWLHVMTHTDPRYGGMSAAVPALATSIAGQHPIDPSLAAFCLPGEQYRPKDMTAEQVTFWPTSRIAWSLDRNLKTSFAEAVRSADGLHIHGIWDESTAVACRLARKFGKPYVLSAHGMLEPWALATKRLKKSIYAALIERSNVKSAGCLHALTQAEAEQYRSFGATCPIAVIPNAVELPQDADAELFLHRFPELRGKRIVLFLSRLHPKKGLDLLVKAWATAAKAHPQAHLVIAGPDADNMQPRLLQEATSQGIANQVSFTGMLGRPLKWSALRAVEAYVLPSYSEGLSMALLEAMGMSLPVIATRACNMPEIATSGAGWEIDATAPALTSALSDLLNRTFAQNQETGSNGARVIAERYTPLQVARQMAEVYAFVLGGPLPQSTRVQTGGAE